MNFNLDFINRNLPKKARQIQVAPPKHTFLQDVLFGGESDMGNEAHDGFFIEWRRYAPQIVKEAVRGADPERLNFQSKFNAEYFVPSYYHNEEEVKLSDADARVFGEELSDSNVSTARRVLARYAEKRDALDDAYVLAKEKMCADMLTTGKVVNKAGDQAFPMTSALLQLSGSNLWSKFLDTFRTCSETIKKKNGAFRPDVLIFNPTYAQLCVDALKAADLFDKDAMNLARVRYQGLSDNGLEIFAVTNAPTAPTLTIAAYYGTDSNGDYYIPNQKAFIGRLEKGSVGGFGYGRVRAYENGLSRFVVVKDRTVGAVKGYGDMRTNIIEKQSAPLPSVHNIDGWGLITSIPSTIS